MSARQSAGRVASEQEHAHLNRGRRALLTGGALSVAAVAGNSLIGARAASATQTQPVTAILPSNDTLGNQDLANITDAFNTLPTVVDPDTKLHYAVGSVLLGPGDFYVNAPIVKPPKVDLIGSGPGTVIFVVGGTATTGVTGISSHHDVTPGQVRHFTKSGTIADLVVDGTGAGGGAGAIGIDVGDGWGHRLDHVWINNFTGDGAIGLSVCNQHFWTEKLQARHVTLVNNSTAVQHWLSGTTAQSQEYQDVEYYLWMQPQQNGIVVQGVNWNGSMRVRGNVLKGTTAGNAVITLKADPNGAGNAAMHGFFDISTEANDGTGAVNPASIMFADANQGSFTGTGYLRFTGGQTNAAPGQIQFRGMVIEGNQSLQAVVTPAFPASGPANAVTNTQNDANVYITGTNITQIQINGIITGVTSGQVFVPAGATISVTYTGNVGNAGWKWISALGSLSG